LIPRLLVSRDLRLRVLVASGWWTMTASQTMSRIDENVVVTETRVRTPLGPPTLQVVGIVEQCRQHARQYGSSTPRPQNA
jgi:hypothetical protein